MVSFSAVQTAFSAGEISPYLRNRSDMEFYRGALASCVNFIPDQFGALHRRPGTRYISTAKAKPCFYSYDAGEDCPAVIVATPNCFEFIVDGVSFGEELTTEYGADSYCDLKVVSDCGAMFIVHPNHAPKFIVKTDSGFELRDFPRLPYAELNSDRNCRLCLLDGGTSATTTMTVTTSKYSTGDVFDLFEPPETVGDPNVNVGSVTLGEYLGNNTYEADVISGLESGVYLDVDSDNIQVQVSGATLQAIGCEPFTAEMVGQFVRILDEDGKATVVGGSENNDPNTWLSMQVIDFVSSTEIVVSYAGEELTCTDLFFLPAYSDGVYPSSVWIHNDRLFFGKENCLVGSRTGNFFSWEPTEDSGSVVSTNAIYTKLDAGKCQEIKWLRTNGRYLIAGTDRAIYAISGAQGAIAADDYTSQLIQSIGVSDIEPVSVADKTLFVDRTCTRIFSVEPGVTYDQLSMTEKTIFADHIAGKSISSLSFSETPFPLVWIVTDDGCLSCMTYWPSQGVQSFSRHELGGHLLENGCRKKPVVCSTASQRSSDKKSDLSYFSVKRTINGEDVFYIERLGDFFGHETRLEDAQYLDASFDLRNVGGSPITANWRGPVAEASTAVGRVAICDNERWYFGESDGETITLETPNSLSAVYGRTWVDDPEGWRLLDVPAYGEKPEFVDEKDCLFVEPCGATEIAFEQSTWDGLHYLNGEMPVVYMDGFDLGVTPVSSGQIAAQGAVGLAGFPYVSEFETLPWRANLGVSDGSSDFSSVSNVSLDVYRSVSLKAVDRSPNRAARTSETCDEIICPEKTLRPDVYTGWNNVRFNTQTSLNDRAGFVIRADGPFPATVRAIKVTFNANMRK